MTTTTAVPAPGMTDVIDAMRSIQTESDRWTLAEALHRQVPSGLMGFNDIVDAATAAGIDGLSATTLRLYRDAAIRWPADQRVPNVSFSAHREAMTLPSISEAAKVLGTLSRNLGPSKVTVAEVRKAVAIKQGKAPKGATTPATKVSSVDVLADLKAGAPKLIAAVHVNTPSSELDTIHAGLTKAIAHVERLRAKAARKATTAKAPAKAPTTPTKATAKATTRKAQGDLRGL